MKLRTEDRRELKKSQFALPSKRKYPIPDYDHAIVAVARAEQQYDAGKLSSSDRKKIYKTIWDRYPDSHDWPSMEKVLGKRESNPRPPTYPYRLRRWEYMWYYFVRKYLIWGLTFLSHYD